MAQKSAYANHADQPHPVLDGRVRPIRGALSVAIRARDASVDFLLPPEENVKEAAVVGGMDVYWMANLRGAVELIATLCGGAGGSAGNRPRF